MLRSALGAPRSTSHTNEYDVPIASSFTLSPGVDRHAVLALNRQDLSPWANHGFNPSKTYKLTARPEPQDMGMATHATALIQDLLQVISSITVTKDERHCVLLHEWEDSVGNKARGSERKGVVNIIPRDM